MIALVLAARYGARGLYAVPGVIIGVQVAEWFAGGSQLAMLGRLTSVGELAVLIAIAVITMVGVSHETRAARLQQRVREAEQRASEAEAAVGTLSETAIALRERFDRTDTSIAFLSDLAAKMDAPDPASAADAAISLAMARTGARGGVVQLFERDRLKTVTSRGAWSADRLSPPAVFRDVVAAAAIERLTTVAAHEVTRVTALDSDLAAPLLAADGTPIGVLALRGISSTALTAAAREDLAAVARWASRSFVRTQDAGPPARTGNARGNGRALA